MRERKLLHTFDAAKLVVSMKVEMYIRQHVTVVQFIFSCLYNTQLYCNVCRSYSTGKGVSHKILRTKKMIKCSQISSHLWRKIEKNQKQTIMIIERTSRVLNRCLWQVIVDCTAREHKHRACCGPKHQVISTFINIYIYVLLFLPTHV